MTPGPKQQLGRKDRKALRHWAGIAWDRELGAELAQLGAAIDGWKAGQLSPHDVSEAIHEFHNGAARGLLAMKIEITIRAANPSDAPFLNELLAQLGYPAADEEIPARLAAL